MGRTESASREKINHIRYEEYASDLFPNMRLPLRFMGKDDYKGEKRNVLSLFSGCGGMDLGFEGYFIANSKSFPQNCEYIEKRVSKDWILLKKTMFKTVFACDILPEAQAAWVNYMSRFHYSPNIYHLDSIVDMVKAQQGGADLFPHDIDIVTGGFPCQDFSLAGKRKGFMSMKDHRGNLRTADEPSEETRGKLYFWMKQVIDITKPKMFIAENVRGLVNLGNVKDIIQRDFASADGNGYIVLAPRVLRAYEYGVPESRERVIFIGIRRNALLPEALAALEQEDVPDEYNPYPKPTHSKDVEGTGLLKYVTTADVLSGLKEPEESEDASQRVFSKARYMSNGSQGQIEIKLDGLAPTIRSEHHGNIEFRRLDAEHGGKHELELALGMVERRLTPRECALIQTFPPDYPFVTQSGKAGEKGVSASGAYKIIGNAVPPVLAYNIATRIQSLWKRYFG